MIKWVTHQLLLTDLLLSFDNLDEFELHFGKKSTGREEMRNIRIQIGGLCFASSSDKDLRNFCLCCLLFF